MSKVKIIFLTFFLGVLISGIFLTKQFCTGGGNMVRCLAFGPVFSFKVGREKLAGLLIFGDFDQANWHLTLGRKRLTEAESQIKVGNQKLSLILIKKSLTETQKATPYLLAARKNGEDVNFLINTRKDLILRQKDFLSKIHDLELTTFLNENLPILLPEK